MVGASKVVRDITERKKAELVLLSERNFSEAVIASLPGILYLYDRAGRFLRWNRNMEVISGYSPGEIAGMSPLDFFAPADQPMVMQRIQEVLDAGCEPHVQPVIKLNSLDRKPIVRHDWTEQKLYDVARWVNGFVFRRCPFEEYDRTRSNRKMTEFYDEQQGLFTAREDVA